VCFTVHWACLGPSSRGQERKDLLKIECNGSASKGVVIETASEAAVLAPAKGVVIFAGEYRSYGKLVVIDLGCDLRLLMAGLGTVTVQHADAVEQGVRLGAMAVAKGGANYLPVLYVELRRGGQTIDPGPEISGAR